MFSIALFGFILHIGMRPIVECWKHWVTIDLQSGGKAKTPDLLGVRSRQRKQAARALARKLSPWPGALWFDTVAVAAGMFLVYSRPDYPRRLSNP
jgi:hypothetical protein